MGFILRTLLFAGTVVFSCVAAGFAQVRTADPPSRSEITTVTRTINVDGYPVRTRTAGLGTRKQGQPVVIFESGGATPLETWDRILPGVVQFAPVVTYDRAGTGESPWDGLPPTPEHVGTRLTRLLDELKIKPYVMVGHSWGGALVRYFVGNHPGGVAGVLYLDPTDITLTTTDLLSIFDSIGAGKAGHEAFNRIQDQAMAAAPAPLRAEAEVVNNILRSDIEQRAILSPPKVPTSVIVAGRVAVPPGNLLPFDAAAYADAMHKSQVSRLQAWVVGTGTFEVAANSGHFVQEEEPELVVKAIRRLVESGR